MTDGRTTVRDGFTTVCGRVTGVDGRMMGGNAAGRPTGGRTAGGATTGRRIFGVTRCGSMAGRAGTTRGGALTRGGAGIRVRVSTKPRCRTGRGGNARRPPGPASAYPRNRAPGVPSWPGGRCTKSHTVRISGRTFRASRFTFPKKPPDGPRGALITTSGSVTSGCGGGGVGRGYGSG